jgi:hypothetical protein
MNEQLKQWNVLVTLLEEKVENSATDVKLRYVQEYSTIKLIQNEAATKIAELESTIGDAWHIAKVTANKGLHTFGVGLAIAISDFK